MKRRLILKKFEKDESSIILPVDMIKNIEKRAKENVEEAKKLAIEYMAEHPKRAGEVMTYILDSDKLPKGFFIDTAVRITKTPKTPDSSIYEAVENKDGEISDEGALKIVEKGNVNVDVARNLINNMDNNIIKEKAVEKQLETIYDICDKDTRDEDVVRKIDKLKIVDENESIRKLKKKIIAKRMAINCNKYGRTKIMLYRNYLTAEEMIETDFVERVKEEYEKIEDKKREFNKESLKADILKESAENIIKECDNIEDIVLTPEFVSKLDDEEKKKFTNFIKNKFIIEKPIKENELNKFKKQIHQKKEKIENVKIINELKKAGVIEKLEKLSPEKREKCILAISKSLEKTINCKQEKDNKDEIER